MLLPSLLNAYLKIQLTDERTVLGRVDCIDWQGNIILKESKEYRIDDENSIIVQKGIGRVLLLRKHIAKIMRYTNSEQE